MIAPLFATDVDRCRPTLKGAATNIGIILGKTSHGLTDIDPDCGESGERHTTIQATSLAKRLREGMERNLVDIVANMGLDVVQSVTHLGGGASAPPRPADGTTQITAYDAMGRVPYQGVLCSLTEK
jgi:hypothetical protein